MRVPLLLAAALIAVALLVAPGLPPPVMACGECGALPPLATMIFNCGIVPEPWAITVDLSGFSDAVPTGLSDPDHALVLLTSGTTIGISWGFAANTLRSAIPTSILLPTHGQIANSRDLPMAAIGPAVTADHPLRR